MILTMPAAFESVYTQAQRDALAHAYEDRKVRPAKRVCAMAAAGELELDGRQLDPFDANEDSVRHYARLLRKGRAGMLSSRLGDAPHRDAVETLRRRLVNAADEMLTREERKAPDARTPERLRQIVRLVREVAALPGPTDPRPPAPGAKRDGQRVGGETQGGLAGQLLADHRRTAGDLAPAPTAPDVPPHHTGQGDNAQTGAAEPTQLGV